MSETPVFAPKVIVYPSPDAASREAAKLFADSIRSQPDIVLGLATGGTPVQMYADLVRQHRDEQLDFSQVTTFNLDEYIGLSADHPQSYRTFMQRTLFDAINVTPSLTHVPDGLAVDPQRFAAEYESRIAAAGGIDLQLLGIGKNGHIAFNEPGSPVDCRTQVVQLTQNTIESNSRFFESIDNVPKTAITMGIGTILEAKQIVLLAMGDQKATAVKRAIEDEPSESHPASWLQTHSDVTFILDQEAASKISV